VVQFRDLESHKYVAAVGRMLQFYSVSLTSPGDYHYSAAET
jgi:hypothetical protein